jgi:riboflavin transporter FmnP
LNIFVLIPAYVAFAGFRLDVIIGMGTMIFPAIHDVVSLALICVIPFNLVKGILVSVITALLYKHVSPLLHR